MSWRDRLRVGSFRGVEFSVDGAGGSGGRRVALHEYPQQEKYHAEDLGLKAEAERLTVYLVGANYDLARDKLMAALKKPGSGKLVHPYLGTLNIQVQDFDWSITTRRGGYCEFTIQYIRAGKITPPTSTSNKAKQLTDASVAVNTAIENSFVSSFTVDDTAAFVEESALEKLDGFVDSIRAINGQIAGYLEPIDTVAAIVDDFGNEIASLILQPANLVSSLVSVAASAFGAINDIKVAFKAYDHLLAGFGDDLAADIDSSFSVNRAQEAINNAAINTLIVSAATVAATNSIVTIQSASSASTSSSDNAFITLAEAQSTRDKLLTTVDSLIDAGATDEAYFAWADLQASLVKYIADIEPNLATSNTTTLNQSVPALVMAYNLYGDANREAELVNRNSIANPVFMPAGVELEVLS
ncbi:hypothetical protein TW85_22000 [Marinomonas sp. S3726]|uniref:DNA circularization protein n=1 Tax=Marinomonas sp. S3726 TaxID=579484 RepID=UPI0005F9DF9C|nr:DNA circularization N-terminal domain-containing protein [Marinomonas sp. S3726]KJZ09423.1 hypothetical protein TW85_22000 [Marinomonas sp. S3726]